MPGVPLTFFFLALVIFLGFVSLRIFQATRFPDIPLLLATGLLIGPLNQAAVVHGFGSRFLAENVDANALRAVAPFISTLALIVILFDSGLKLNFAQFGRAMRPAFAHTLPLFMATVFAIAVVAHYVMGMPPLLSVVLGVALSNVGQTVSAALIREIDVNAEVRSIYFIEMAIYDLISIPLLVSLLEFAKEAGTPDMGLFTQSLARVISISCFLGVVGGLVWIYLLLRLENYPYSYMVVLAGLLFVYSLNSFLHGSGPVSVLIFGLVIGNRTSILRFLKTRARAVPEGEKVHTFHDEIAFFVRAFYFVFLGMTFSTGRTGEWGVRSSLVPFSFYDHTAALFLVAVALIFGAIVGARYLVVRFISSRSDPARRALFTVYARGLGTAVLATFPFTLALYQPVEPGRPYPNAYTQLFQPWEPVFVNGALLIILLTVLGTSVTVWVREFRAARGSPAGARNRRESVKE